MRPGTTQARQPCSWRVQVRPRNGAASNAVECRPRTLGSIFSAGQRWVRVRPIGPSPVLLPIEPGIPSLGDPDPIGKASGSCSPMELFPSAILHLQLRSPPVENILPSWRWEVSNRIESGEVCIGGSHPCATKEKVARCTREGSLPSPGCTPVVCQNSVAKTSVDVCCCIGLVSLREARRARQPEPLEHTRSSSAPGWRLACI